MNVRWAKHELYGRCMWVFSPIMDWTTRMNAVDRLPERITYYTLIAEGWVFE